MIARNRRRHRTGFTLVEVLVVLVIGALIVVLLAEGTRSGTASVATLDRRADEDDRFVAVDGLLRALIRQAVPQQDPGHGGLVGTEHRLVLRTVLPIRPAGLPTAAVDASLEVAHGSLNLVWRTHYPSAPFLPLPLHVERLIGGVTSVEFAFAAAARQNAAARPAWRKAWRDPELPILIRIRIRRGRARAAGDWPDIVASPAPVGARM